MKECEHKYHTAQNKQSYLISTLFVTLVRFIASSFWTSLISAFSPLPIMFSIAFTTMVDKTRDCVVKGYAPCFTGTPVSLFYKIFTKRTILDRSMSKFKSFTDDKSNRADVMVLAWKGKKSFRGKTV